MAVGDLSVTERTRLRCDQGFLIRSLVDELRNFDKEGTEVVSAAAFSRVLDILGLHYGSKEVDQALQHCKMGGDGFLNYAGLAKLTGLDNVGSLGNGTDEKEPELEETNQTAELEANSLRMDPMAMKSLMADVTPDIKSLYSQWDKGLVSGGAFIKQVEGLGVPLTPEFKELVLKSAGTLGMTYRDVIKALHVGANLADSEHIRAADKPERVTYAHGKDLIGWREDQKGTLYTNSDRISMAKAILADFVDGKSHEANVRRGLQQLDFNLDVNFDRILQKAKTGDRNSFRDMTLFLSRQHRQDEADATAEPSRSTHKTQGDAEDDTEELRMTARSQVIPPFGNDIDYNDADIKAQGYGSSLEPSCMLHGPKSCLRRPQSPEKPNRTSGDIISWRNDYGKKSDDDDGKKSDHEDLHNILNRLQRSTIEDPDQEDLEQVEAGMSSRGGMSMVDALSWTEHKSLQSSEKPATRPYGATRAPFAIDEEPIRQKQEF